MSEDITRLMRSGGVPIEPEGFAYKILNASLNGIYIHDVKLGQNVFINTQYTAITGYTLADLKTLDGTQFFELFHPDDRQQVAGHMEKLVCAGGETLEIEYRFKTRDGRWIWCLSRDSLFAHNQDGAVSQIIGTFLDITERKRVEDALRASEEKFRTAFANAAIGFVMTTPDGRFVDANPAYCALTGYGVEELRTLEITRLIHPDDFAENMRLIDSMFDGNIANFVVENRYLRKDGSIVWVRKSVSLVRSAGGLPQWIIALIEDITENKQADKELRQSRKDLERAQEVGQIGSWRLDVLHNVLTWSDESHRIFGVPKGTHLTYETFLGSVHPDERQFVDTKWKAGLRGEPYDIEHRIIVADEIRWVREKAYLEFDEVSKLLGGFGITQDITARKKFEEELRRSSYFPEENPNPVLRCTPDGETLYTNPPARNWLATFGRQTDRMLPEAVHEAVAEARRQNHTIETEITDPAGRMFRIFVTQPPGEDYVNLYAIDLTDRKRAEEALKRSNGELEQFAYVASHDLQEPLRAVVGFLQLLQSRCGDQIDEKGQHYIERSVKAAHRMQTLIRQLLTLSRVNTSGAAFVATDLNGIVNNVLDNLQSIIQKKNAGITCARLPNLTVDASQIQSLFQNLVMNAVRYNQDPKPSIDIGCRERDHLCDFFVKDNGIGIPPQFHQRIFMVFQRLHTDREYPGTGLGLALCKKIVERHGGKIWVESQPQEGSTFHFTLPRSR